MSGGVLVLGGQHGGEPSMLSHELLAAARALSAQGAGPVEFVPMPSRQVEGQAVQGARSAREAHAAQETQAAVQVLIDQQRPAVVLATQGEGTLGFAPALAARGGHGFACNVVELSWGRNGVLASHGAYGEQLLAERDFPGKQTVVLLLRPGAFAAAAVKDGASSVAADDGSDGASAQAAVMGQRDPAEADVVLAIGRGVTAGADGQCGSPDGQRGNELVARMQRLAEQLGAALAVSGPLSEAGLAPRGSKVGQSGKTVAPRVYLAFGVSGATQHLAGMASSDTIVAINSDANARIFDVAQHGAVADLFEVASALERKLA
jgi:electron transfer flavoprotein alpha subunit